MVSVTKKRGRSCSICGHPERHLIEAARISGVSLDAIAAKWSVSRDSVFRHMKSHVTEDQRGAYLVDVPVAEMARRAAEESTSLIDYLSLVRKQLIAGMLHASACNDLHALANLGGKNIQVLEAIGRLTGEVSRITSVTNNNTIFLNSPQFLALEGMLMRVLAPHPEALGAVVEGLRSIGASAPENAVQGDPIMLTGPSNV